MAIHLAMRHKHDVDRQQLNELIGIDPQLLTRPTSTVRRRSTITSETVPSSEFVRLLHENGRRSGSRCGGDGSETGRQQA